MKSKVYSETSAINRAASGKLTDSAVDLSRASSIYGFQNKALRMSEEEIRSAWKVASSSVRKHRG